MPFRKHLSMKYGIIIKTDKNVGSSHPYTLPSRSKNQPHEPKLVKEYGCPNAERKENEEARAYNKNIVHAAISCKYEA